MKKIYILTIALFTSIIGFSQSFIEAYEATRVYEPFANANGTDNAAFATLTGNGAEFSKIMGVLGEFDDITLEKKGIEGSVMFFKKGTETNARLYSGKKIYSMKGVNYNIESEIPEDRKLEGLND